MEINDEKRQLRAECHQKIQRLSMEEVNGKSARITTAVCALLETGSYRTIGAYSSFGKEVGTEALIRRLLAAGHQVALPVVSRQPSLKKMDFRLVEQVEALVPGVFGILEPQQGKVVFPEELEIMLLPGLAFSRTGERLGRGGGYYDRYLAKLPPEVLKIGLAFSEQIAEALPTEEHDLKVDMVITEKEVIYCRAG